MLTLHTRRRIGTTMTGRTIPHARFFRACNADQFAADDDALAVGRGIVAALALAGPAWAAVAGLIAVLLWAIELLAA